MILGVAIEASIYIVVVFLCLSDCFRAVVEETQDDSILDWWSMGTTWSMHLVLTRRLSACVYITLCYYISLYYSLYFPSKKIYVFVRECGVSVNRATCTTLCVFETNKPHALHRRNHRFEESRIRLLFLYKDVSWCWYLWHRSCVLYLGHMDFLADALR